MADSENKNDAVAKVEVKVADNALPAETLDFFNGDEIRARVFYEKYALKDKDGITVERTPRDLWERVSKEIASVEKGDKRAQWQERFKWLLTDFRFLPGGRILFGAGQSRKSTLLNCYVIPVKDDTIEAIFDWCKEAARTYSYGGGVGTDISILRPKKAPVNNSAVVSTGSTSFMNIFSETTHTIGQQGRRGALMITMSVDHPDILDFIRIKRNLGNVRYANISVRITDEFMRAVKEDKEFTLRFENKVVGRIEKKINARFLWNELVQSARDWAEPGLVFWDTIKKYSPSEYNGMEVISTNPCSEQPLQPYGACDLGNLNLSAFVTSPFTKGAALDWGNLETATRYATRFLDNVLDYNDEKHPLKEQTMAGRNSRRIGVGITGLADMLVKLSIKYDSEEALKFVDELFNRIKLWSYDESVEIAKEKGSFLMFDRDKHASMAFIQTLPKEMQDKIYNNGLRNVAILTVPPTGSVSVLAGTSSGVEPIFAFSYTRRSESLSQGEFKVFHPLAFEYMKLFNIAEEKDLPEFFVPAHKIKADFRVRLQGVIQKHIDSAISSTVNLPEETTVEEVGKIYFQAWEAGCKGITVYREGSREGILITEEQQKKNNSKNDAKVEQPAAHISAEWKRESVLTGQTMKIRMQEGPLYVTANYDNTQIREVFVTLGSSGSEERSYCEAMGRLISKYLQQGGDIREIVDTLKNIKANSAISYDKGMKLYSVPDAIAKALEVMAGLVEPRKAAELLKTDEKKKDGIMDGVQKSVVKPGMFEGKELRADVCPHCSERTLVNENGCFTCKSCSYTKCE
ncbi:MAG: adenosylcobalamin-dependent ribonucleoside-diphosphate reductase [Candidatus Micrarchaeota archaeon]|nr:adenosylcobalamin-dependent ribonucleoside-diphosphate reductase [Candidatus Micrarchaeota archaeon]